MCSFRRFGFGVRELRDGRLEHTPAEIIGIMPLCKSIKDAQNLLIWIVYVRDGCAEAIEHVLTRVVEDRDDQHVF